MQWSCFEMFDQQVSELVRELFDLFNKSFSKQTFVWILIYSMTESEQLSYANRERNMSHDEQRIGFDYMMICTDHSM